jgi:MFS family permease
VAFIAREATAKTPLIPLRIFRSRTLSVANIVQPLLVAGMFGLFFMGALYMERVLGYDPLQIGFAFLPATLVMGTLSLRYAEPLITRFGARTTLLPGLVLIGIGLALFTRTPVDGTYVADILPTMLIMAMGIGVSFPALMTLAMAGAAPEDAGLASGLVNTSAQVGGALGLAVLATLSTTRTDNLLDEGVANKSALVSGYHLAFWIGSALVAASFLVALFGLKREDAKALADVEELPAESQSEAAA